MEIETAGQSDLQLQRALLIYSADNGREVAITSHEYSDGHIQPGQPIEAAALLELLTKGVKSGKTLSMELSWADPQLLAENSIFTLWWTPPQFRNLFVRVGGEKPEAIKSWLPGLVWLGSKVRDTLFIFAVAGTKRPNPNSVVYRPAYCNVYGDCGVCIGTMKTGKRTITDWQTGFYDSSFVGRNHLTKKPYAVQKKFKKAGRLGQVIRARMAPRGTPSD